MYKQLFLIVNLVIGMSFYSFAQYLSNLNVTANDPIYTTYASIPDRSEYIVNEGYQFVWYNPEKGINFEISQAGILGLAFKKDGEIRFKLQQYYVQPVITASYSDLVKFSYYPFENVRVDNFFIVYSSRIAILDVQITNESSLIEELDLYPYMKNDLRNWNNISLIDSNALFFRHKELPDSWMKEHNIPFHEDLKNIFMINSSIDGWGTYDIFVNENDSSTNIWMNDIKKNLISNKTSLNEAKILSFQKKVKLFPGKKIGLRIIRGVIEAQKNESILIKQCQELTEIDLNKFLKENEKVYNKIPNLNFLSKEKEALYWNSFNLIRQCIMPPEGKCTYNYYVFSREPKWGWGYGGQVFHESLVMLAYVFMDPISTMNSQRVYIERQLENGYINYRTGPYLDEKIKTNGEYTSSAPFFNWENWEIYKITEDKDFLREAYESGKKFFNYFVSNRDKDNDGLVEWGAHAILESVRDARVAIWDEVADPSNFDALDANVMMVNEAKALASMAETLGYNDEAKKWIQDANNRTELINKYMWDDESGFYYHIDKKENDFSYKVFNDLKRKEIIGFLPMWAGVASKEQADQLVQHLLNKNEFWRNYGIPTLSADDTYYNPMGYWNGPVWVQWNYLIFRGLLNYGYNKEAIELVDKVITNMIYQLKTNHWFWEFYSPDDYQAGWNKTYIWAGIIARMLIDAVNLNN